MARRDMGGRTATLGLSTMLPGLLLVIIIFWALAAVLMLTGTLINAREIDDTVDVINSQVAASDGIDQDLDNVRLAAETNRLTIRIRRRAAPLTGQANQIIGAASSIDRRAKSILNTAQSINQTAGSINQTVRSIGGNVQSIGSTVVSINATVNGIGSDVFAIGRTANEILRRVGPVNATDPGSINASVDRILSDLTTLEPETRSIDRGVAAINRRGDRAIVGARGIKGDFEGILTQVGLGSPQGHTNGGKATIHGHANSIDCSPILNLTGNLGPLEQALGVQLAGVGGTQYCDR